MNFPRYMCSHLVRFRNGGKESVANLEEIWQAGAILECEEPVEEGSRGEVRIESAFFSGKVTEIERHEFGWRVQLEFSPLTPWRPEVFRPDHMVEIARPSESP